jgi:hypothetical protein
MMSLPVSFAGLTSPNGGKIKGISEYADREIVDMAHQ